LILSVKKMAVSTFNARSVRTRGKKKRLHKKEKFQQEGWEKERSPLRERGKTCFWRRPAEDYDSRVKEELNQPRIRRKRKKESSARKKEQQQKGTSEKKDSGDRRLATGSDDSPPTRVLQRGLIHKSTCAHKNRKGKKGIDHRADLREKT